MRRVTSSVMNAVDYDPAARRLRIRFNHGGWYAYRDVPEEVAAGLLASPSHGRYFHDHIRDHFAFDREAA